MRTFKPYRSYRFTGQDPIVAKIKHIVDESGETNVKLNKMSGVSTGTLGNWFGGKTRRPQFATLNAVARSLGYDLTLLKRNRMD